MTAPPATNLAHLLSLSNEWQTPMIYLDSARKTLGGIDLDPASGSIENSRRVGAKMNYDAEDNGLYRPWIGHVYLNPPYGKLAKTFVEKLLFNLQWSDRGPIVGPNGNVTSAIVLLALPHMSTKWFQPLYKVAAAFCITNHRIQFEPMAGQKAQSPTSGSVFIYIGPNVAAFRSTFKKHGAILMPFKENP